MQPESAPENPIIRIEGQPFSEHDYLKMNPDVLAGVEAGTFDSGEHHFRAFGMQEGRIGCFPHNLESGGFFGNKAVELDQINKFRSEYFPYEGPFPWLDRPNAKERIKEKLEAGEITAEEAEMCIKWEKDGYIILKNVVPNEKLDSMWGSYEAAIADGTVELKPEKICDEDPYPGRLLNPHHKVPEFCSLLMNKTTLRWIKLFMGREPAPYQTITAHKGSEQHTHSDFIHMTTYPVGYLTAAWIAFEDIHPDSGPLIFYPGSHKLPYLFSKDVGISETDLEKKGVLTVYKENYVPAIRQLIEDEKLPPAYFHAEKGDMLLWHANLLHGGSKRKDPQYSRKSVVCHYFVKGAISYHDLSGVLSRKNTGTCLIGDGDD